MCIYIFLLKSQLSLSKKMKECRRTVPKRESLRQKELENNKLPNYQTRDAIKLIQSVSIIKKNDSVKFCNTYMTGCYCLLAMIQLEAFCLTPHLGKGHLVLLSFRLFCFSFGFSEWIFSLFLIFKK